MDRSAEPALLIQALAGTVRRIQTIGDRLTAPELRSSPVPEDWSPNEILWHLRATGDVYGEHIARILTEDEPRWRHVSPRARMKKTDYNQLPFAESFAAFAAQRASIVERLERLTSEDWHRVALIRAGDKETRLALHERVRGMASHEETHCRQMEQAAAKRPPSSSRA